MDGWIKTLIIIIIIIIINNNNTMIAKRMKTLELHYPMIQFLIISITDGVSSDSLADFFVSTLYYLNIENI